MRKLNQFLDCGLNESIIGPFFNQLIEIFLLIFANEFCSIVFPLDLRVVSSEEFEKLIEFEILGFA